MAAAAGLVLVAWRWGEVPCTCGARTSYPSDVGLFTYQPGLVVQSVGTHVGWGRWLAAAALAGQTGVAVAYAVRAARSPRPV